MKLSNEIQGLKQSYDAIIIGSGYGGSICAARLAEAGRSVCLLERGQEWETGSFPDEFEEVMGELRSQRNPLGLYDYRRGDDLDVLVGNGLGGTSLINANVVIEPDHAIFQRPRWPAGIREAAERGELELLGRKVLDMLRPTSVEPRGGWPRKVQAMEQGARHAGGSFRHLEIAVNMDEFDGEPNHVGVVQHACTQCGDCVTGCNVGAKNSLMMNYLPYAKQKGAEIYTCMEVRFVLPAQDGGYFVWSKYLGDDEGAHTPLLYAPVVILGAGALGSTGILMRSAERGLALSWRLGHHFSANSDQLGIGYNTDVQTDVLGFGNHEDAVVPQVGPTISSVASFWEDPDIEKRFVIEEGAVPRAFVDALCSAAGTLAMLKGEDTDEGLRDKLGEIVRCARDWTGRRHDGAANHSMIYLGMGHDGAEGRLVLSDDNESKVLWRAVLDRPAFEAISDRMYALVEALGGTYIRNPRWSEHLGNNLITVHPLGGCPMGEDSESGVVDEYGQVFDPGGAPGALHRGLFVADGSIVPDSVGVNPLFTISVLAERVAAHVVETTDFDAPQRLPAVPRVMSPPIAMEFAAEMRGYVAAIDREAVTPEEYEALYQQGRESGDFLRFDVTALIADVERFLRDKEHEARVEGVVASRMYGAGRRVERGRFNLFAEGEEADTRNMCYLLRFVGQDGQPYLLDGFKVARDDPGFDLWADNSALFTRIRRGWDPSGPVVAQGILRVGAGGLAGFAKSIRVRNIPNASTKWHTLGRLGRFYLGELWDLYVKPKLR